MQIVHIQPWKSNLGQGIDHQSSKLGSPLPQGQSFYYRIFRSPGSVSCGGSLSIMSSLFSFNFEADSRSSRCWLDVFFSPYGRFQEQLARFSRRPMYQNFENEISRLIDGSS
jgi:hypothetical protein